MYKEINLYSSRVSKILTPNEQVFFEGLKKYIRGKPLNICPKVRLRDIIYIDDSLNDAQVKYINNQTFPKHLDFVLMHDNGSIKCVIELDGSTHKAGFKASNSDKLKNSICKQLGIDMIRIPYSSNYDYSCIDIAPSDYT